VLLVAEPDCIYDPDGARTVNFELVNIVSPTDKLVATPIE